MVENLIFHDDTITLRRKHIEGICEGILREGLKFNWKAWGRLDVFDKPLLNLMREAGCAVLMCGAESGTERGLHLVRKRVKLKRLLGNTRMLEESGIGTLYSFIAGIPGETKAEAVSTIELVSISDAYEDVEKLNLPEEVLQGFPDADGMIDPAFAQIPSGEFHLVIDLNTLSDVREVVRRHVLLQMRRSLAVDGIAVFLFQNSDDLGARIGRILGTAQSVAARRRPSVKAFRAMLAAAGFAIERERSAGIRTHRLIRKRLSPRVAHAVSRIRLPKSLAGWTMFVCGKGSQAIDIASPAPRVEIAEPPKTVSPAPTTAGTPQDTVTS